MQSTGVEILDRWRMRWRSLWHRASVDQELAEELEFHRASLIEQYQQQGLSRRAAQRRVRLELGGPAQISEEARDQRGWRRLDQLRTDTHLAFRTFRKYPGFTVTAVLTIALGMGANTSLFTVMHAVMFRPLPIVDPGAVRNVYLELRDSKSRSSYGSSAFASFREFQEIERTATTADIAGVAETELSWRGAQNKPVHAQLVSSGLLPLIGARPVIGRFFSPDETKTPGSEPVVVLSYRFWQQQLGGDGTVVGKSLALNRTPFTVIGVADEATRGPLPQVPHVWIPLTMQRLTRPGEALVDDPTAACIQVFARRHATATDAALLAEMQVLGPRAVASHDSVSKTTASVVPAAFLNDPKMRTESFPALALIWVAFLLILVVACANVANMLLARGLSRQREIAVRLALGAGRGRLLAQLLTESGWLGALGGALGLLLALALARVVPAMLPAASEIQLDFSPDRSILAFTAAVSMLSGLAFGLLPALQATRLDLSPALKTEGMMAAGAPRVRLQQTLVGLQVAVCVVLLVFAGLLIRSFTRALTMDVGKPLNQLLIGSFDLRQQQYDPARAEQFFQRLTERVDAMPAVVRSGTSMLNPELGAADSRIALGDSAGSGERFEVSFDEVGAGYFEAAGLRVLAGRTFTEQEVRGISPVIVVDQRFADDRLAGRAVGQGVWLDDAQGRRRYQVIGVVNSTKPIGLAGRTQPTYFVPIAGLRYLEGKLLVRYRGEAAPVIAAIRQAAETIDAEVGTTVETIEHNVHEALWPVKLMSASLSALGGLALALASIGLFGVIGFSVGRRAREIAIRMAVGATPPLIVGLVFRQGLGPVGGGLVVGLAAAIGGGQLIRGVLHGVTPFDPATNGGVVVVVVLAAGLAFWVPARRATAVKPASVLRVD